MSHPASPESQAGTKPWACVSCAHRKIKCDRLVPVCTPCQDKDKECEYKAPAPPNRKKRKTEQNLEQRMLARIAEYESTLNKLQIPFEPFLVVEDPEAPDGASARRSADKDPIIKREEGEEAGQLWDSGGHGQRYYSHGLLVKLAEEFKEGLRIEPGALSEAHSTTDSSNPLSPPSVGSLSVETGLNLCSPSPLPSQKQWIPDSLLMTFVSKLWPVFVENVQPITMILHAPSTRSLIDKVTVRSVASNQTIESFLSSICACALTAMTREDCEDVFSTDQDLLVGQFQSMAQQKLMQAGFYECPSHATLQAYVLLVVSLHGRIPSHTFAMVTSIAIRTAVALGIHREGSKLHTPPFETELRRRLWWFIITMDNRAVELAGLSTQVLPSFDANLPLNLNDEHLQPGMKTLPQPKAGATEMIFVLARYEMTKVSIRCARVRQIGVPYGPGEPKFDQEMDRLEGRLEGHYLRFCDPIVPLHTLTTASLRLGLTKTRLLWTGPQRLDGTIGLPEVPRMIRIVEYDNFLHASTQTRRFLWFVRNHFPWGAVLQLFDILARSYPLPPDQVARAATIWDLCTESLDNHPAVTDLGAATAPRPLQIGLLASAVRAWEARAAVTGESVDHAPRTLQVVLQQRAAGGQPQQQPQSQPQQQPSALPTPPRADDAASTQAKDAPAAPVNTGSPLDAELNSLLNAPGGGYDLMFDADLMESFNMQGGGVSTGVDGGFAAGALGDFDVGLNPAAGAMGWEAFSGANEFNFDLDGP